MISNLLFFTFLSLLFPHNTHAYLDPGTGSQIFQIIIALLIGTPFIFRKYWKQIKKLINKKLKKNEKSNN